MGRLLDAEPSLPRAPRPGRSWDATRRRSTAPSSAGRRSSPWPRTPPTRSWARSCGAPSLALPAPPSTAPRTRSTRWLAIAIPATSASAGRPHRLDDLLTWPAARLTALATVLLAPLAGASSRQALYVLRRDGDRHPSPNAGLIEAAFAGALGVKLGGTNRYDARLEHRSAPRGRPLAHGRRHRSCRAAVRGRRPSGSDRAARSSRSCVER